MASGGRKTYHLGLLLVVALAATALAEYDDYPDDRVITNLQDTFKDAFKNISDRLDRLEKELSVCGKTNFEKTLYALDQKFEEVANMLITNITATISESSYGYGPMLETSKPAGCLPPYERKPQIGCIYLSETKLSWSRAKAMCEDMGAQLIVNPPLNRLLHHITEKDQRTTDFWIGGKWYDGGSTNWRWLDGETISEGWNEHEPDLSSADACAYFNWNGEGLLNDHLCTQQKLFICEMPKK